MKGVYLILVIFAGLCLPSAQGQSRRGSMKYASTVPPAIESGDAFPPSRHIFPTVAPSLSPRRAGFAPRSSPTTTPAPIPEAEEDSQPKSSPRSRFRPVGLSRAPTARKLAIPKEEPVQNLQETEEGTTLRPATKSYVRKRPVSYRTQAVNKSTPSPSLDPNDEPRQNNAADQPLLQRSVGTEGRKTSLNAFALRKANLRQLNAKVNGGKDKEAAVEKEPVDIETEPAARHPIKPTRRTFTRKVSIPQTTPANVRPTKRYNKKKNALNTDTTEIASDTTPAPLRPFRVSARNQKPSKAITQKNSNNKKKYEASQDEGDDNYPEHFKLLLQNSKDQEEDVKVVTPTKATRKGSRDESIPMERPAHARKALMKPRTRPFFTTTTIQPPTPPPFEAKNLIDDDLLLPIRNQEQERPTTREGRTFSRLNQNLNRLPHFKNSRLLDSAPQTFTTLRPTTSLEQEDANPTVFPNDVQEDVLQEEEVITERIEAKTAQPLPPAYNPAEMHRPQAQQQQSVRYIDTNGKYITDQDIAQYANKLRQQLLRNLISILSSALQSNSIL